MKRIQVLYQMDKLLTECKSCERPFSVKHVERCQGCSVYSQLREIGKQLEGNIVARKGVDLTVEEFIQLHYVEGKKYEEIAELKGVDKQAVSNWKYNRRDEVEKALKNAPQNETKGVLNIDRKIEKQSEYESLISDLKAKVQGHEIQIDKLEDVIEKYSKKEADYEAALAQKDDRIMELEGSLVEAQNQIDYLNAACDDIEHESNLGELEFLRNKVELLESEILPIRQLAFLKLKQDMGA